MNTPDSPTPLAASRNALFATALALLLSAAGAFPQGFDAGSSGADGALVVTTNRVLQVPPDGVFQFTTVDVRAGASLTFAPNALNTPVHLLAQGPVTIDGRIQLNARNGTQNPPVGGLGGPGGFSGGHPGTGEVPPGAGLGPGGARGGILGFGAEGAAAGSFGATGGGGTANRSAAYGSPLLIPMIGGSGGGGLAGTPGFGGGGGGGALLIASSATIVVNGAIEALGGNGGVGSVDNGGSGGGVRLVAPRVAGAGTVNVNGADGGGHGRIRVDTLNRQDLTLRFEPVASATVGSLMMVFPNPRPRLDIVGLATTLIPVGTNNAVFVQLPFGAPTNQVVKVQARDFAALVPLRIVLTPDNGAPSVFEFDLDNRTVNPALLEATVGFPVNTQVAVQVFTR